MLKFWQKIKSDLPVMSQGSGLPQKFKVMSEGRAGLKKVQSRGVPGGGMVPEQFEWHIIVRLQNVFRFDTKSVGDSWIRVKLNIHNVFIG